NRGHPLLEHSLRPQDALACDPSWGTHDHDGHGTAMAGIALYGDQPPPRITPPRPQIVRIRNNRQCRHGQANTPTCIKSYTSTIGTPMPESINHLPNKSGLWLPATHSSRDTTHLQAGD
ncbi:S8 family serine peptidase, partial [Ferrimicrobium sp.]|uniref:S8 family serine peptidase n=1 Tax=Ferrimicrobium sp. TaxID=2926050 RepID=UPI002634E2B8